MKRIVMLALLVWIIGGCQKDVEPLRPANQSGAASVPSTGPSGGTDSNSTLVSSFSCKHVLVDASRDGGVWWFPFADNFPPTEWHQGSALAIYLRSRGYTVDELGRDKTVMDVNLLNYGVIIRACDFGEYSKGELDAYRAALNRGVTLLLLSDHSPSDQLAKSIGIQFSGSTDANAWIDRFAQHALTDSVSYLPYIAGSAIESRGSSVTPLGWLPNAYGGGIAMALVDHPTSNIFALGDTNVLESVPQPFTRNLVRWIESKCMEPR